jgi:hypothetical protein
MSKAKRKGDSMSENNITINNVNQVNVPRQSRGAGTVLLIVLFWWALPTWWLLLATFWVSWLLIAGVITIFSPGFFTNNWYYPWPAWTWGIR